MHEKNREVKRKDQELKMNEDELKKQQLKIESEKTFLKETLKKIDLFNGIKDQ